MKLRGVQRFAPGASVPACVRVALAALALTLLLGACSLPGSAAPVVKIGVIAPFEGAGRPLGYAVLPAVRSAVAAANADSSLGRYRVSVVAFNDNLDAGAAAEQARALALDGDVMAVVGPFTGATAAGAQPVLEAAGLAGIPVVSDGWTAGSLDTEAAAAAAATRSALDALAQEIRASGRPTRAGVLRRLVPGVAP